MPGSAAKKKKKDFKKDVDFKSDSCVFNRNIHSNIMLSKNNLQDSILGGTSKYT